MLTQPNELLIAIFGSAAGLKVMNVVANSPKTTLSTSSGATEASRTVALVTCAARSVAEILLSFPQNAPKGVRFALTMKTLPKGPR